MLETIKSEIQQAEQLESFAEFYQSYTAEIQDKIIEQEVQHIQNLISSDDDKFAIYSQINTMTKELML